MEINRPRRGTMWASSPTMKSLAHTIHLTGTVFYLRPGTTNGTRFDTNVGADAHIVPKPHETTAAR